MYIFTRWLFLALDAKLHYDFRKKTTIAWNRRVIAVKAFVKTVRISHSLIVPHSSKILLIFSFPIAACNYANGSVKQSNGVIQSLTDSKNNQKKQWDKTDINYISSENLNYSAASGNVASKDSSEMNDKVISERIQYVSFVFDYHVLNF